MAAGSSGEWPQEGLSILCQPADPEVAPELHLELHVLASSEEVILGTGKTVGVIWVWKEAVQAAKRRKS